MRHVVLLTGVRPTSHVVLSTGVRPTSHVVLSTGVLLTVMLYVDMSPAN